MTPQTAVVHNADVQVHEDPADIVAALQKQLWQPVHWTETIQYLVSQGVTRALECGPGKVLAGLNRRIDRSLDTTALVDAASIQSALGGDES